MKIQEVPLRAMARWFQAAEILSDVDADGHDINNFDGTQNPAMAWKFDWIGHPSVEGAGQYDQIVAPDMMVEHPVYRVS